jgi:outer membrane protein assembly factor BamB
VLLNTASGDLLALQADPAVRSVSLVDLWQHDFAGGKATLDDSLFAQPVLYGGRPIAVLHSGAVWSLDPSSGDATALGALGEPVSGNAVLSGTLLYAGTETGHVVAYDLANGRPRWSTNVGGTLRFGPALSGASVFAASFSASQSVITALDRATGALLWRKTFNNGSATPVPADGRLYVAGERIAALDPATGEVLWQSSPFVTLGALISFNGVVYAGRDLGQGPSLVALDGATGKLLWSASDAVQYTYGRPALDPATHTLIAGAANGELLAYDAQTGASRWHFQADAPLTSDLQVQAGIVYFTASTGDFYAVEAATGRLLSNFRPGADIFTNAAPLVLPDRVFTAQGLRLFGVAVEVR